MSSGVARGVAHSPAMVYDPTHKIEYLRNQFRKELRQQHALGINKHEGRLGGELYALEVAHEMLTQVHQVKKHYALAALQAVLLKLEHEYRRMGEVAGGISGPWFLGFSQVWRRVLRAVKSLPPAVESSQFENSSSLAENS